MNTHQRQTEVSKVTRGDKKRNMTITASSRILFLTLLPFYPRAARPKTWRSWAKTAQRLTPVPNAHPLPSPAQSGA